MITGMVMLAVGAALLYFAMGRGMDAQDWRFGPFTVAGMLLIVFGGTLFFVKAGPSIVSLIKALP